MKQHPSKRLELFISPRDISFQKSSI